MLLLLSVFFALAPAAPLEPPLNFDAFQNLTATNRCSNSPEWQAYAFLIEDCFAAIQRVYIEGVLKKPVEIYEFIAEGIRPRTQNPWVRTPVQYTVNSCTLSIVMLDWFSQREFLPGRGPAGYSQSDTATFRDVWNAARVVETDCLLPTRRPGWDVIGSKSSIGVFLWATDSSINDQVTGRAMETILNDNRLSLPDLPTSPNASSSSNIADSNIDLTKRDR